MADGLPTVDDRRASALRDELGRNAQMLAPDWAGLAQEGDFGRALLEIAARLAEHSTSGLDKTPLRDKLAFLDALDVATPAPQPATAPIVFTLAEKRNTMVFAPARVQLTAKQGKDELTFETRDAIDITPARIAELIVADPATDTIERAPGFVTRSVDSPPLATSYLLLSAVEANSKTIQLVESVGIAPGDLLRLAGNVYRVDTVKDGIVQLLDTLDRSVPAGATVEKLIALGSFALRNLQEHAVYFGHKEMFKLDGSAEITLVFDPPTLPTLLAGLDLEYSIWGKRNADANPDWQTLDLRGAGPAGLVLAKTWAGSVEELKLPAGKSRWLRMRLQTPIAGACGPATGAVSVKLAVRSTKPRAGEDSDGSDTIGAAFYNSQPLPTATAFFPFGTEPQRFDTFAFSAPEALSKKGAVVTLNVVMVGADLQTMTWVENAADGSDHVYGISRSGRLQAIYLDGQSGKWRQLGLAPPPMATSTNAAGELGEKRFDPSTPLAAMRLPVSAFFSPPLAAPAFRRLSLAAPTSTRELLFARDVANRLLLARIDKTNGDWTLTSWEEVQLPAPKVVISAFCLLPPSADSQKYRLLGGSATGFYAWTIDADQLSAPQPMGSNPAGDGPIALALASAGEKHTVLALIDDTGRLWRCDTTASGLAWQLFTPPEKQPAFAAANPQIQPAAFLDAKGELVVVAARNVPGPNHELLLVAHENRGELPAPKAALGTIASISSLIPTSWHSSNKNASQDTTKQAAQALAQPLILISGSGGTLTWSFTDDGRAADSTSDFRPLPTGVDGSAAHALALPPSGAAAAPPDPQWLLNAGGERLLYGKLTQQSPLGAVRADLQDVVRAPLASKAPAYGRFGTSAKLVALKGPWIEVKSISEMVQTPPSPLAVGENYALYDEIGTQFDGATVNQQPNQLVLDASDTKTASGDFLRIGGKRYEVTGLSSATPPVATLDRAFGGDTSYRLLKKQSDRQFGASDLARIAKVPGQNPDIRALHFAHPTGPLVQPVDGHAIASDSTSFYLGDAWTASQVPTPPVTVQLLGDFHVDEVTPILLPRNADNPALSWEYHDAKSWRRLDKSRFSDTTANLAKSGPISFIVPDDLAQTEIAGKQDYWLRVRLIGGDYGRPAYDIISEPAVPPSASTGRSKTSITIDRSQLNPPEILSIEASYVLDASVPPDIVLAENNLAAIDQTQAALANGAVFDLFEGVAQHVGDADGGTRALYIGLGKRPDVQALRFYADILDRNIAGRKLVAEALIATGWKPIGVQDETGGFTRPGMIQLDLVPSPEQLPLFGEDGWWLRLRPKDDAADWAPVIRGLFVNAVTAEHAKTVTKELLGSSLGDPDQRLQLAQNPVLPATLDLRVLESLGEEERAAIAATFGADAIAEDPEQRGVWVRWANVTTFVDSDGDARVYRLDPASGEVQFGNGRNGKVPPAGRDSIRAFSYQWGGGSAGNVPAQAIAKLNTALESIDLAMNPVDAAGGADAPRVERLAVTAPALLRHGGQALTPADIEAIAVDSAPDVVRARCLPRQGCGIVLAVAIRDTGQRCPTPSRARREGIARNILSASWGALAPDAVVVRAPRYIGASVKAEVIAKSADALADVEHAVRETLTRFLHPVEGGVDGLGWPFGRRIWPSDLQRAVVGIAGLDRVIAMRIKATAPGEDIAAMPLDGLVCVSDADLNVIVHAPEGAA